MSTSESHSSSPATTVGEQRLNDFFLTHRRTWVEVSLDSLAHNVRLFNDTAFGGKSTAIPVIKANAYGHGAVEVAVSLYGLGVRIVAVAIPEEGIQLRLAKRVPEDLDIIVFGASPELSHRAYTTYNLIPSFASLSSLRSFAMATASASVTLKYHIKIDTGMGRIGFQQNEIPDLIAALLSEDDTLQHLSFYGIYTHFSKADEDDKAHTISQVTVFQSAVTMLEEAGLRPPLVHCSNSAAATDYMHIFTDEQLTPLNTYFRLGISLYGLAPSGDVRTRLGLKPLLSWKTTICHLKDLPVGHRVSYGGLFISKDVTMVATLPVGYADGYRRRLGMLSAGGPSWHVLISGKKCPILGRVCMDMIMVDVTAIRETVSLGDEVVLLGSQGDESISADAMAAELSTINYEITCLIGQRVPRVYFAEGEVVSVNSELDY